MKFRKKPVVINAIKYTRENIMSVMDFVEEMSGEDNSKSMKFNVEENEYYIITLEGNMKLSKGDFLIQGVNGEFYPCKPDIFQKTYDIV